MASYYNLASTPPSISMIGALISFAGVGLLILILSERMFHGLRKLIYFFGNQILTIRKLISKNYIEENKPSNNQIFVNRTEFIQKEVSLAEQKEWLEKILKMKV
tara:strand:- start:1097 stop:1408 length:312 start_codon:yes stop_codon:yes gene_type:complete